MTLILNDRFTGISEPEVKTYIDAVEAADQQLIEFAVANAINDFVRGCKNDAVWDAITACCILAGARTLTGALRPLKGPAPTSFNFVSDDYDRKTGLVGNGSNKYLNINRNNNTDPQNDRHLSVYKTQTTFPGGNRVFIGDGAFFDSSMLAHNQNNTFAYSSSSRSATLTNFSGTFLLGVSRNISTTITCRNNNSTTSHSVNSTFPRNTSIGVFAGPGNVGGTILSSGVRIRFYSAGTSLNPALLDTRVTTLMNTFTSVIPS
jgi:hypothetical protein